MENIKLCTIDGCKKPKIAKGLCRNHYALMRRNGSATIRKRAGHNELLKFIQESCQKNIDTCIIAPFGIKQNGYAAFWRDGKKIHAHREACTIVHGEAPSDKHHAAHSCNNRSCINPKHLRWATCKENQQDKIAHGTQKFGSDIYNAKLTEENIKKIRSLRGSMSQSKIANIFGISQSYVSEIQLKKVWNWLKDEQ